MQAFINTHFDLGPAFGADVLRSPAALAAWFQDAGLLEPGVNLTPADLERTLTIREGLRDLARTLDPPSRRRLDGAAAGARIEMRFTAAGPRFAGVAGTGLDGALGALLAIVGQAVADGSWSRLKICPGHHCGWAFYDHSRNRSGRWCSMSVCGGREKARAHYRRRRDTEA